jgi:signal transduction histidine kinase
MLTIVGRWDDTGYRGIPLGTTVSVHDEGVMGKVWKHGKPARLDDYTDVPGEAAEDVRKHGIRSIVAAPVFVSGAIWGALAVGTTSTAPLEDGVEERLTGFADLVSLAVSNAQAWESLLQSRARIVEASSEERRRLGRNLHDGAQQRLVTVLTFLRIAEGRLTSDPATAREVLSKAIEEIVAANHELRELARGLHPVALSERGLDMALRSLTRNASLDVTLDVPEERLPEPVEAAMYYVAAEALANATKYAEAECVQIVVRRTATHAWVEVADDGQGGADPVAGSGLRGLNDRVEALRGQLEIDSAPRRGTTLRATFPL